MQIMYYQSYTSTKKYYFSVFLSGIMQNSWKGGQEINLSTRMKKFHFWVKYAVFSKNENEFLKNSDFWYT